MQPFAGRGKIYILSPHTHPNSVSPPKKTVKQPRERLFLLDGMALAYRAYFSFISRPLINSKGENTSAIFGFVNALMKILSDDKPDHIAVVFDTREPTFRHLMYDAYKATREKMPEDMAGQIDKLKEVVQAFNVPTIELAGYEADDIMGTLARRAEQENIETFLVTGDKDFMQLISPLVKIYRPGKRGDEWEILDSHAVQEKFGVDPGHVIDVLGLTGDSSDNVPGVYGVGEKTAIPLVQKYGSVESILGHVDEIPQKGLQQKLREHRDEALLSKKLVTIDTNVPIAVDLHHLVARPKDDAKLLRLFNELEFRSLARKLSPPPAEAEKEAFPAANAPIDIASDPHAYHLVATMQEFDSLVGKLRASPLFVFDTETTSTDPLRADLVGLSFAVDAGEAWYVPVRKGGEPKGKGDAISESADSGVDLFSKPKSQSPNPKSIEKARSNIGSGDDRSLPLNHVLGILSPLFSDPSIKKVGQNIKYDALVLAAHAVRTEGIAFDTMVANYILRPDGQHNLDSMALEHLNYKMISYDDLTGTGKDRVPITDIDLGQVADYSAQDADMTLRLYRILERRLRDEGMAGLGLNVEFPLIAVLADMELSGVSLDVGFLADLSKELERLLETLRRDVCSLAGETFNLNSTQQLSKILFDKLKLSVVRKTKTGFSTDVGVLETLRNEHPIIEKLLEYRMLQKLKSTYVDALPALINPATGRLHTSFNQTVAATGRLSSSDPNLQNIPIRTEVGRSIRQAFVPASAAWRILSADYSQIELRVMAHVSGDEGLAEAFRNREDIHATTASKVFGVGRSDVTKEMRRKAKEVNFGIMYGIGPYGLATRLDIGQPEAKEIIARYFQRFPKVNQYIQDTLAGARRDGYVSTVLGRRRYLPDINSRNFNVRSNAERQAINMPIQGTAADMIKLAMINIHRRIMDKKLKSKMLLQVHDELVFEIPTKEQGGMKSLVAEEMKNALPLSVPVEVEVGVGKNWLEAH